jgi:hypothetical protein
MYGKLLAQLGIVGMVAALTAAHGSSAEIINKAHQEAAQNEAETTTIELNLKSGKVKEVELALGQSARAIFERLKPAQVAVDDDPWLLYLAPGGGHYALFFRAEGAIREMEGRLNPDRDQLYAVIHYPAEAPAHGKFLLPEEMRDTTVGEFFTLKVRTTPRKATVATVALGMTTKDVMHLFQPARDHAKEDDAIVFNSIDGGGRYLLLFSSQDDSSPLKPLSQIIYWAGAQSEPAFLLPQTKRGEQVHAKHKSILESNKIDTTTD